MISLPIIEQSQVGAARRRAVQEGEAIGLSDDLLARLALVVTEAGTNLVRHAEGGEILLVPGGRDGDASIAILALDRGPGIGNVEAAMADGYTTSDESERGIGGGLGALRRMSDRFDIHSDTDGTTVMAVIGAGSGDSRGALEAAGLVVPKPGFSVGGDAFAIREEAGATVIMLMDVLGHGPAAADEAKKGVAAFVQAQGASLERTEAEVAAALGGGRGAAALIVEVPHEEGVLRAAGLGNVRGEIAARSGDRHGIPSTPGIVGSTARRPRLTEHAWPREATLILTTDGLKGPGRAADPLALYMRHPLAIAGALYKRRGRGTDDCGVVIARGRE